MNVWLKGLAAAFISAAATAASGAVATKLSDLRAIGVMALVSGITGTIMYLRQSPVPKCGADDQTKGVAQGPARQAQEAADRP
jgi:hypothetical protein